MCFTKSKKKKSICFITGVPGAGKTLAGLNIAIERQKVDEDEHAVFLSGNGPFVDVLQEALCRDDVKRNGVKKTTAMRKTGIRKTKTDKVDSLLICKTLMVNSFRCYSENDIKTLKLKSLCRFRQNLKKSKARLKIQLTSYVDVILPELQSFFKSGLHIKTCYELLKAYSYRMTLLLYT